MCEAMANGVRSICTLCNYLRILQGVVHNRAICPDRLKPPRDEDGRRPMGRGSYLRLMLKVIASHSIWRIMPILSRLIPDMLAPLDVARHTFLGVPFRIQDSPFMENRPKAKKARKAWEMDLQSRRDGSFYWREVISALEELARWLRMEMILFKKEIMHYDSSSQEIPGALMDRIIRHTPP